MAFSLKAHDVGASADNPTTAGVNTSGADLIVVGVTAFNGGGFSSLGDNKGNSFTALAQDSTGETERHLFYVSSPVVGSGHTFTANGTGVFGTITMTAWSGSDTSGPFDVQNHGIGNSNSFQPGSVTPTKDGSLIISNCGFSGNPGSVFAIDSSFTISDQVAYSAGVNEQGVMAYLIQGTAAAINPTWSWTNSGACMAGIAVFKPGAGAAPTLWAQSCL